MKQIAIKRAYEEDLELAISIQNEAFYEDYQRMGIVSGYDRPIGQMRFLLSGKHIFGYYVYLFYEEEFPVGMMILRIRENLICHISSLCVITSKRNQGIGTSALRFIEKEFAWCKEITLETPSEKKENIEFYHQNGYMIKGESEYQGIHCTQLAKTLQKTSTK